MLLTTNRGSCDRFHAALPPFYLGRGKQENADRTVVPAHHTIRITSCCEFKRYWSHKRFCGHCRTATLPAMFSDVARARSDNNFLAKQVHRSDGE
jgi:hypothetical protein